ncbi:MAG: hypothetical protein V8Q76_17065 [Bacteroides intestinalis]
MNKRFLSAILFGALMVGSTGTFTSCKDYDDDIKDLQGQLDKKASLDELNSKVSALEAAINGAKLMRLLLRQKQKKHWPKLKKHWTKLDKGAHLQQKSKLCKQLWKKHSLICKSKSTNWLLWMM